MDCNEKSKIGNGYYKPADNYGFGPADSKPIVTMTRGNDILDTIGSIVVFIFVAGIWVAAILSIIHYSGCKGGN